MKNEKPITGRELLTPDISPLDRLGNSEPIQDGELISFNAARDLLPRSNGRKVSLDTLYRWSSKGTKKGVRLQAAKVGNRWFTSRQWLQDFIRAGNPDFTTLAEAPKPRTNLQRQRAAKWAKEELHKSWNKPPRNPNW